MCLEPLASSTGRLSLRAWESWEVLKVIPALSSRFRTRAISAWGWGVGEHPAAGLRVTLRKRRPPHTPSPGLRKGNQASIIPRIMQKRNGECVSLFMCVCYRQTNRQRQMVSLSSPPAPGEAVHRLFHTCGSQQLHIPSVTSCGGSCGGGGEC